MKILIAEDDFLSRKIILNFLKNQGECDVAHHGKEAWEAFQAALSEGSPYDLVCIDVMMPEMNGVELLEKIRELEQGKGITIDKGAKIIMTTSVDKPKDVMQAFRKGCEAYIVKPLQKEELFKQLEYLDLLKDADKGT
jgi:two-component system chemotaxis response regulator CheY